MLNAIAAARNLDAAYGALLAVLMFALGMALLNWRLGLLASALFMLDPYVIWRNHFNYLEPLATLFGLLMIYFYYVATTQAHRGRRMQYLFVAGLFFGLSMLTKELALLYIPPLIVHWLLFRRASLGDVLIPPVTGALLYSLFPIWAAMQGEMSNWWDTKTWLYRRMTGQIQDTGIGRPGSSILRTLGINLPDYWPWFLMMGVAGVLAVLFLYYFLRYRVRDVPAEFLTSFVLGTYGYFVVVRFIGGVINEHFFYFVMPIAIMSVAYAALSWPRLRAAATGASQMRESRLTPNGPAYVAGSDSANSSVPGRMTRLAQQGVLALLLLLSVYNLVAWVARYGLGRDDSYAQVEGRLANVLPPGVAIVGRDLLDLYLMPKQNVYTFSYLNLLGRPVDPANVLERKIPYAILNDQSLIEGYGGANPAYYDWVRRNGEPIQSFQGRLYETSVYQLDYSRPVESFGTNSLAVGKPAVASSTEDPSKYPLAGAFDALITTRWASNETDNEWIYVDLGEAKNIGSVQLSWEEAFARSYELQVSDDAQNWTTFFSTRSGTGGLETIYAAAKGRYVRLLMTERGTEYGYSLWEISIYP
jgi:4-amino-4-deoxy-L-arabinose transferase-like glycosyltransferase